MQVRGNDARLFRSFQDDRTGTVTEQHASSAVGPVHDAAKRFGTNDQRALGIAKANEFVRQRECVHEAAARRFQGKCRAIAQTQLLLHEHTKIRKDEIGRAATDDDEVNFLQFDTGSSRSATCSFRREVRSGLAFRGNMAALYARTRTDPFVRGVDHLLEVGVRQHLFRQVTASARDP